MFLRTLIFLLEKIFCSRINCPDNQNSGKDGSKRQQGNHIGIALQINETEKKVNKRRNQYPMTRRVANYSLQQSFCVLRFRLSECHTNCYKKAKRSKEEIDARFSVMSLQDRADLMKGVR